jgi:thiamine biosynthesis protein ThiI
VSLNRLKPKFDTVVIRLAGEIGIKASWTRKLYERRLISNIKKVIKQYAAPYEALNRKFGRLYLKTSRSQVISQKLGKVFGISSVSPALETTSKLSDITERCVKITHLALKKGSSFAVRCRRVGKHNYTSQDVCREVGRQVLDSCVDYGLRVDLNHPNTTLILEIREDRAYISTEVIPGVGGLPLGVQPKVVCLLNEDPCSSVAGWMVMKRGCPIVPLHFEEIHSRQESTARTIKMAQTLFEWAIGFPRKVYVVSHDSSLAQVEKPEFQRELKSILSKRLMYRVAQQVAEMEHAEAIVTGESLNQIAGKKLHILNLQDEAAEQLPIHRPLIGLDTTDIEELAKRIGIHEVSSLRKTKKRGLTPKRSLRKIRLEDVKEAEATLNVSEIVEAAVKSLKIIEL